VLVLRAVGRFQLLDDLGIDRAPSGQKARGVIALLALAPNFSRSRSWLQDKLWSDRGQFQAAASLRQALTEIRHALGPSKDALGTDRMSVSLDPNQFNVSFELPASLAARTGDIELFEDLDVKDPEFEHWVRDHRSSLGQLTSTAHQSSRMSSRHTIVFLSNLVKDSDGSAIVRQFYAYIAKSLMHRSQVCIVDHSLPDSSLSIIDNRNYLSTISINLSLNINSRSVNMTSAISDCDTGCLYWTDEVTVEWPFQGLFESPQFIGLVSQTLDSVIDAIAARTVGSNKTTTALRLFKSAQLLTFTLNRGDLERADQQCRSAFEMDRRGSYLAWRALIRLICHFQYFGDEFLSDKEHINVISSKALEDFADDPTVLSIASHAEYLFGTRTSSALHLAELAIDGDALNPIAWAALANIHTATGNYLSGFDAAKRAVDVSAGTKAMYFFNFYCCMAATGVGDFTGARVYAQTSSMLSPKFLAPRRYLVALQTASGDQAGLTMALSGLRNIEPSFDIKCLLDGKYPVNTLRRLRIIEGVERSVLHGG
jgi:hypothetical protein